MSSLRAADDIQKLHTMPNQIGEAADILVSPAKQKWLKIAMIPIIEKECGKSI